MKPDVKKLRQSILQLAVEGKLVAQDASDTPASDLSENINSEKAISKEEQPYSIPESWLWMKLTDSYYTIPTSGSKIKSKDVSKDGKYPVIDQGQSDITGYTNHEPVIEIPRPVIIFGDHTRAVKYVDYNFVAGADGVKILCPYINPKYLYYFMQQLSFDDRGYSRYYSQVIKKFIPIPPIKEQKRIVEQVEALMALCDELDEKSDNFLEALTKLRQTILLLAVEGRLAGSENEYDTVTLGDIIRVSSGEMLTKKDMQPGDIPVYGGNGVSGYHNTGNVTKRTVVIGRVGVYCGSVHITPETAWITDNAFITRYDGDLFDDKYIYWLLSGTKLAENVGGAAQPVISGKRIYPIKLKITKDKNLQDKVVEKVESLMSLCDELETKLSLGLD